MNRVGVYILFFMILYAVPSWAAGKTVPAVRAVHQVVLTGFTRPRTIITLESEESAKCLEVTTDVGQGLPKNGLMVRLDSTYVGFDLEENRANQARIKAQLKFYEKEYRRYEILVKSHTAAQTDLDNMVQRYLAAGQELSALEVQEKVLLERQGRHRITGPAGWKVIQRDAEPGEWITSGEQVAVVGDFNTLLVPYALTSVEYRALKNMSGPISLYLPELDKAVSARIELVNPDFDPETRKIDVRLEIAKGLDEMRGGLRCELTLDTPDSSGEVIVPASAVKERFDEFWVKKADGTALRVTRSGRAGKDEVKIFSKDIKPGDELELEPQF